MKRLLGRFGREKAVEPEADVPPDRVADATDPAVAAALRIMAEAGAGPEEARLAEELEAAKLAYDAAPEAGKPEAMRKVAELSLRHALARAARKRFRT